MDAIKVSITRFLGYDPQPGIVELELIDASGSTHIFVEKTAVVMDDLRAEPHLKSYPRPGYLDCTVLNRKADVRGREVVTVSTENPWAVESTTGQTVFEVYSDQLTNLASS